MSDTRFPVRDLRRRLLDEALGRENHADFLSDLTVHCAAEVHGPTLSRVAHAQRIRAMDMRGRAAGLAMRSP